RHARSSRVFCFKYCAPDHFGDLRDNGISEGFKSVHPSGNPMSHSTHVGFREPCCPRHVSASFRLLVAPRPLACKVSGFLPPL
ncbi:hypothetical protein, partial [Herbaspirillum sp.]|uniref:hypothetical protein n=1 Tax=Herbaspirillum sp. TaxID=1890675 RepID=UPI0025845744